MERNKSDGAAEDIIKKSKGDKMTKERERVRVIEKLMKKIEKKAEQKIAETKSRQGTYPFVL